MFGEKVKEYRVGSKVILPNKDYLVLEYTKEELEKLLVGKVVRFWTKDCKIMPDFDVTAPVSSISYFPSGEISIGIIRRKTGRTTKTLSLSSRMVRLKFRIISD